MKNKTCIFYILCIISCILNHTFLSAQSASVAIDELEFRSDTLFITYSFINYNSSDKFNVWIEATKLNGETISAKSLSGDVGNNVKAGKNKIITWDIKQDEINIDTEINIEIKAEKKVSSSDAVTSINKLSIAESVGLSFILPGMEMSKLESRKPYWILAVATYGSLATSVVYYKKASSFYDKYLLETEISRSDFYYNESRKFDNISKGLLAGSAAIWLGSMIWTVSKSAKLKKNNVSDTSFNRCSFCVDYENVTSTPLIGFRLKF